MGAEYFFAAKSISLSKLGGRKPCTLLQAAEHNKRETQAKKGFVARIDPARTPHNEAIMGPRTAAEVVALANQIAEVAGVDLKSLRKDHCQAIELVFSVPDTTQIDDGHYFRRCVAWVQNSLRDSVILSADIHRDENAPHCHVLLSPVVQGRMAGSALIARKRLQSLRESFFTLVAGPAGFHRPGAKMVGAIKVAAATAVVSRLEETNDPVLQSHLWSLIQKGIHQQPLPYLQTLNIDPHAVRQMTIDRNR